MAAKAKRMTVDDVNVAVAHIAATAGDAEAAHSDEDRLYLSVLREIAARSTCKESRALARAAIKTQDVKFSRWCG